MSSSIGHPSLKVDTLPYNTSILEVPLEITCLFFTWLTAQEIGTAPLVCKQWHQILEKDDVWRILLYRYFPDINHSIVKNFKNFRDACQTILCNFDKVLYVSYTLPGHKVDRELVAFVTINGNTLFSVDDACRIKGWDLNTKKCIMTLQDSESERITSLAVSAVSGRRVFCGADECTLTVWDIDNGVCQGVFGVGGAYARKSHSVGSLITDGDGKTLYSGADDGTITIWDLKTGACERIIEGHRWAVCSLAITHDGQLISAYRGGAIKIWNPKTGECARVIRERTYGLDSEHSVIINHALVITGRGELVSGSGDGEIKIWNPNTGECTMTISTGGGVEIVERPWPLATAYRKLFSTDTDGKIKVWDLDTGKCTATFSVRVPLLEMEGGRGYRFSSSFGFGSGKLAALPGDGTIKILDFTASHSAIFEEIARLLDKGTPEATREALERFSRMPKTAKDTIYEKLYEICKPFANPCQGCAKDAFYDQKGQSSTPAQKAQAIRDYLRCPPKTGHWNKKLNRV